MKVTIEFLKEETCNFDVECLFFLDLSKKGLTDLGCVKECVNLENLNLSSNDLKDISALKYLPKLQFLNLSRNKIESLEGLENLEFLKSLNLSGNNLGDLSKLFKLRNCSHLTQLRLTDLKNKQTNPLCVANKDYIQHIQNILPNLEILDGEYLKLENRNILKNADEYLNQFDRNTKISRDFQDSNEKWLNEKIIDSDFSENNAQNEKILEAYRNNFKELYESILISIRTNNASLDKIESDIKSSN